MSRNKDKDEPEKVGNAIGQVLDTLYNNHRPMPAHFNSCGERTQSFCIDFPGLTEKDEYYLASETYYRVYEFVAKIPKKDKLTAEEIIHVLRIGEDLAIGAFMLQRKDWFASFDTFQKRLISDRLRMFSDFFNPNIVKIPMVKNYFDYCVMIGRCRANII